MKFESTGSLTYHLQVAETPLEAEDANRSQLIRKEKNDHKKYVHSHGITPPFKNVRKKRFRKTAPKKIIDDPEVEKEVSSYILVHRFCHILLNCSPLIVLKLSLQMRLMLSPTGVTSYFTQIPVLVS